MTGVGGVTRKIIADTVRSLDLSERPLMVHSSLSSFGQVEGGAKAVIAGILDQGCTVMIPSFSGSYEVCPPESNCIIRNGMEYRGELKLPVGASPTYSPDSKIINSSMGVIPATVVDMEGRSRGIHAVQSFASIGPLASELVADQTPTDVFAPIRNLATMRGSMVMMGVGLDRMTALHAAEEMAGRVPFRQWAYGPDGARVTFAIGGCSSGFENLRPALSSVESRIMVGQSLWRIFPASAALEQASKAILARPSITRCGKEVCASCEDAIAGGAIIVGSV